LDDLYLSTRLRYLRKSKDNKKAFMDAKLNGPSDDLVRGWRKPGRIRKFKNSGRKLEVPNVSALS
jgi:hypothetical protein